jgi:hypothetical protein
MTVLKKNPINKVDNPADVNIIVMLPPFTIAPSAVTATAKSTGATR